MVIVTTNWATCLLISSNAAWQIYRGETERHAPAALQL